jgi:hypothetical protein
VARGESPVELARIRLELLFKSLHERDDKKQMSLSLDKLPFNWFDVAIVIVIIVGIQRGRKNGLSVELLGAFKWIAIVFGSALLYAPLAGIITSFSTVFSTLAANLTAYLLVAMILGGLFACLKKGMNGKLIGSDVFGRGEFYLGMGAGMIRFVCILIGALALLNARFYSKAETKAAVKYQNDVYGSNFFPTLQVVQSSVFENSLAGPWIKNRLSWVLINPTAPEKKELTRREMSLP